MENRVDFNFDEVEVFTEGEDVVILFKNDSEEPPMTVRFDPTNRRKIFKMMLQAHRKAKRG